jgi:hypothetical protein
MSSNTVGQFLNPKKEILIKSGKIPGYPKGYLVPGKKKSLNAPTQNGSFLKK